MNKPGEYGGVARIGARFVRSGKEEVIKETEEVIEPAVFKTAPAMVTRGYGLTLNLGNYESARFDVTIVMPCYPEDVDACDEWCRAWVEKRTVDEVASVRGSKGPKKLPGAF
mgnify:FL=1